MRLSRAPRAAPLPRHGSASGCRPRLKGPTSDERELVKKRSGHEAVKIWDGSRASLNESCRTSTNPIKPKRTTKWEQTRMLCENSSLRTNMLFCFRKPFNHPTKPNPFSPNLLVLQDGLRQSPTPGFGVSACNLGSLFPFVGPCLDTALHTAVASSSPTIGAHHFLANAILLHTSQVARAANGARFEQGSAVLVFQAPSTRMVSVQSEAKISQLGHGVQSQGTRTLGLLQRPLAVARVLMPKTMHTEVCMF